MSMNLIIREITGPYFNLFIVQNVLLVQQSFYFALLACIFTLQIVQTLKLFFSPLLTDWTESKVIKAHRIFVFTMGMCTGALVRIFRYIFKDSAACKNKKINCFKFLLVVSFPVF